MKLVLPEFKRAKVMVVGDIMLDRYCYGYANCISPEAPVLVVKIDTTKEYPGGAANVAMNIASLGVSTQLIGLTGIDDAAKTLDRMLSEINVKCNFITSHIYSTIIKLRVFSKNHQLIRLDFEKELTKFSPELIYKLVKQTVKSTNVIVLSDYAKGTLTSVQEIIQLARKENVPVLIDPKGINFERYRGATLLTPNLIEFEAIVGKCKSKKDIVDRGTKLISNFELSALLVTRSEQGMTLLQLDKAPLHIPTKAKKISNVIGAGDTMIAVIAATLASGNTLEEACHFASVAAGIVVSKLGTSTISLSELESALNSHFESSFGIMTEKELKSAVIFARQRGEKVVMTNGVFDILHAGHISYLEKARKLGDRLIVAVNDDNSTKRLKGEFRPINPLKQRMIVLSALKSVDWVVSFKEDTPQRLVANILPDILVKGGDYKIEQIAGSKEIFSNGGKLMVLNFIEGFSTTDIIKKIQKSNNHK